MRKLKLQMQLSVDGFVAGPNGEMDWMVWDWDDVLINYVTKLTEPVDCIIMGHNLAAGFIPHWAAVAANPDNPEYVFGKKMTDTPKIVFTRTLKKPEWKNTALAKGDLEEEISHLKNQEGKDIIVYGGARFVSGLIQQNLIDEYHLFINPAVLGNGMPIWRELKEKINLKLLKTTMSSSGIAILCYEPLL
jgi:dihydrofolate reductase